MSFTIALPWPAQRYASQVYERHPDFGDYIYSPDANQWRQHRAFLDGKSFILRGQGRRPNEEQIAQFQQIDAQLVELQNAAIAAVDPPPVETRSRFLCHKSEFRSDELALREIDLGPGIQFDFFFDTKTGDKIGLWPIVTFCELEIKSVEWAT